MSEVKRQEILSKTDEILYELNAIVLDDYDRKEHRENTEELIYVIQGLLDLYQKEKEKNKELEVAIKTKLNFATSAYEHFEKEEMHNLALVEAGKIGILQELLEERN